jgi:hypothetical protein
MKLARYRKRFLVILLVCVALFAFWFVTASASMAVDRIVAGTGQGPIGKMVIDSFDWYASPMHYCVKIRGLGRLSDYLEDKWCSILDAPETTP